ncbi:MAG: 30S ribosomal protein S5 [Candidatus Hydrothermales bacterium]
MEEGKTFIENIISLSRVVKVVTGGRRFKISAWVAVGDGEGKVGIGHGKAAETPDAIAKALKRARKNMINVPIINGTIPHPVLGKVGASKILLKPAGPGTGLIACHTVRAILEAAGYRNVLTKSLGSTTPCNLAQATMDALSKLKDPRLFSRRRGLPLLRVTRKFMIS